MAKIPKKSIFFVIILIIFISIGRFAFETRQKPQKNTHVTVTTQPSLEKDMTLTTYALGTVHPSVEVDVKSRVDGTLLYVGFNDGENVRQGDIIFKMDPAPFKIALDEATANLARDQAQLDNLKKLFDRLQSLVKKGYVSKQDYDQTYANLKASEATILADKAAQERARLNLDYCTIRAPLSGRTGKSIADIGNLIKTDSTLVSIYQIQPITVTFSIPEHQLNDIKEAYAKEKVPVFISLKNSEKISEGHLSFIDNTVDNSTGMIQLKAVFSNEKEALWPGQYVNVTLPLKVVKKAIVLPTRAILAGPKGAYVFVVQKNGTVTQTSVTIKHQFKDETIIEGLEKDRIVVITGQSQLAEGSQVESSG
jgi:membrane fusion protein, multidrug efflux system